MPLGPKNAVYWSMKFRLFVAVFFLSQISFGQFLDEKRYLLDSIKVESVSSGDMVLLDSAMDMYHGGHDTVKLDALNLLSNQLMHSSWGRYAVMMVELAQTRLDKGDLNEDELDYYQHALGSSLNNAGMYHKQQGNIELGMSYYRRALKIQFERKDSSGISAIMNNLGFLLEQQGVIDSALYYHQTSLELDEIRHDTVGILSSYNSLALTYHNQDEYESALTYYLKCYDIFQVFDHPAFYAITLGNIGSVYKAMEDNDQAKKYYLMAIERQRELGDNYGLATSLGSLAGVIGMDDYPESVRLFKESIEYAKKSGSKSTEGESHQMLGTLYYVNEEYDKALEQGNKAYEIAKQLGYPQSISQSARTLYRSYAKMRNWEKAYFFQDEYYTMRDSLVKLENAQLAIRSALKNTVEKKALADSLRAAHEIENERTNSAKKDAKIQQEKAENAKKDTQLYAVLGGLGLMLILAVVLIKSIREKKKANDIISAQKKEAEHQKELVEEKNQEILDSITYAKRIQAAILPPDKIVKEYLGDNFVLYKPKDIVAGDFYWMDQINGKVLFSAADCTGHGVPGAMVSVVCNNAMNRAVREFNLTDPGKILDKARVLVTEQFEKSEEQVNDGMDLALCVYDESARRLSYAGANNPIWVIRNGATEIEEIKGTKQAVGHVYDVIPFQTHELSMNSGDTIYIFSDGYADQFGGERGKKYKNANFKKLLLSIADKPMDEQKNLINTEFEQWKGNLEQLDDVCVIGVRF